jgi:L-seryl-tRNA(Ser) seleniumtransferase
MRQSGATLVEVGTTNRTHPRDYISSITEHTALLLKVHTSNFAITGFASEVDVAAMVQIGMESGIPVMVDAGSGSLIDLSRFGIAGEATVQHYIKSGADVVTFSGDKLLGGPQAGIILGKTRFIEKMKRHQLLRPLRIDKLTLAALEATLRLYRDEDKALAEIPTLRMLTISLNELSAKARRMLRKLRSLLPDNFTLSLSDGYSSPGGGSFPLLQLPSRLIDITVSGYTPHRLEEILRKTSPPVVGRLHKDRFLLDARTIAESELSLLATALLQIIEYKP